MKNDCKLLVSKQHGKLKSYWVNIRLLQISTGQFLTYVRYYRAIKPAK